MHNKNVKDKKLDLFERSKKYSKKPDFSMSSNNLKKGESVELLKPTDAKNLYEKGILVKVIPREDTSLSPLWEIKMNTGEIEYCEENFLLKCKI